VVEWKIWASSNIIRTRVLSACAVTSYGSENKKNFSQEPKKNCVRTKSYIQCLWNVTGPMMGGEIRRLKLNPGAFYCVSYAMAAGKYEVLKYSARERKIHIIKHISFHCYGAHFFQHLHTYVRHLYKAVGIYNFNGICSLIV